MSATTPAIPGSHGAWVRRRLARSLRVRIGALALACIALPAVFAELVAADEPIIAVGPSGVVLFPAVLGGALPSADRYRDDFTIWPLVRHGPRLGSAEVSAPRSADHPLGTDARGRDLFARVVYGARVALGVAAAAIALATLLGAALGAIAGYFGGFWDEMLARPIELIETFPAVVAVAVVRAVYPNGSLWSLAAAVAAVRWAEVARLVRAEVLRTNATDFVTAARALGSSHPRILLRHVLPYAMRPTLETALFGIASVVVLEVSVSFLGLGVDASWGAILAEGILPDAPLAPSLWAGAALLTTVASAYLLADAVGEAWDARLATSH